MSKAKLKGLCVLAFTAIFSLGIKADPINYTIAYNQRCEVTNFVCGTLSASWKFDARGNRVSSIKPGFTNYYVTNCRDQYIVISNTNHAVQFEYDEDGNLTKDHRFNYQWDAENRLVAIFPAFFVNEGLLVKNGYDHLHRRVKKEVWKLVDFDSTKPPSPDNGKLEQVYNAVFVYDWNNIIFEKITYADKTECIKHYFWGKDKSGTIHGAAGIGGLLAVQINDKTYFALYDAGSNIMGYVDEQGKVVAEFDYDPFGELIRAVGTKKDEFNFRFSTKYLDHETLLYNFGRRFYDPWLGRWLSPDPIGEAGGINLYCFVANDPVNNVDALGLYTLKDAKKSLSDRQAAKEGRFLGIPTYSDRQIFEEWLRIEQKLGSWWRTLPKCLSTICIDKKGKAHNPDNKIWTDPKRGGFILGKYHPGGVYEMRTSKSAAGTPHGNQCVYDQSGNLMENIPAAGSADLYGPSRSAANFQLHQSHDVKPFELSEKLNRIKDYYSVRPVW